MMQVCQYVYILVIVAKVYASQRSLVVMENPCNTDSDLRLTLTDVGHTVNFPSILDHEERISGYPSP